MQIKDYYRILEVDKKAELSEIKKAYRRLAKKMHPDLNPNDSQTEERFKEIAEAYSVLSDPEKRRQYDYFIRYRMQAPNDFYTAYKEKRDDIFQPEFSGFFNSLFKKQKEKAAKRFLKGNDRKGKLTVSLEEVFSGSKRILKLGDENIRIQIWPGIENKRIIKIKEKGYKSKYGGRRGDLYIKIVTEKHPVYQRHGSNLLCELFINPFEALHGTEKVIDTLHGEKSITVPELSAPDSQITAKSLGLPIYKLDKEYGDLIITLRYKLPKKLSFEQKELLNKIIDLSATTKPKV